MHILVERLGLRIGLDTMSPTITTRNTAWVQPRRHLSATIVNTPMVTDYRGHRQTLLHVREINLMHAYTQTGKHMWPGDWTQARACNMPQVQYAVCHGTGRGSWHLLKFYWHCTAIWNVAASFYLETGGHLTFPEFLQAYLQIFWGFRPRRVQRKCPQMIATTTDNRK